MFYYTCISSAVINYCIITHCSLLIPDGRHNGRWKCSHTNAIIQILWHIPSQSIYMTFWWFSDFSNPHIALSHYDHCPSWRNFALYTICNMLYLRKPKNFHIYNENLYISIYWACRCWRNKLLLESWYQRRNSRIYYVYRDYLMSIHYKVNIYTPVVHYTQGNGHQSSWIGFISMHDESSRFEFS